MRWLRPTRRQPVDPVRVYSDPLQHALIAAAVVAPLVPRAGSRVVITGVAAALAIDVDHAVAARSLRVRATTSLATRPRTHSVLTALGMGAVVGAAAGPVHGWAAFAGLTSHLLHDAGDRAAPTPLLWPFAPPRQVGRRQQAALTMLLALGSLAVNRAAAPAAPGPSAASGSAVAASAPPRTA
jgi:hypothetical protein